ncbi:MAG: hypothetical protein HY897_25255, partial [Deltaproteobacteria bacterium]|nr:hypothetical protein [Deltaproteobacteria bacterium]
MKTTNRFACLFVLVGLFSLAISQTGCSCVEPGGGDATEGAPAAGVRKEAVVAGVLRKPATVAPGPRFQEHVAVPSHPQQQFTDDGHPLGLDPPPPRFSNEALGCLKASEEARPPKFSFDPAYDPRPLGLVTPVRDQGACNASWAFATCAAFESLLLPDETRDFSENNLKNTHGFDRAPCGGGNFYMSTAYHARGSGPVSESDDPYDPGSGVSPPGLARQKQIMDVLHLPVQPSSYTDYTKNLVLQFGAVAVGMYYRSADYNPATYAYVTGYLGLNLTVTIVGWDDTFPASNFNYNPGSDGAWIVKNAWGTGWGDAGYFYVSYNDASFGQVPTVYAAADSPTRFDRIVEYDPFGWTDSLPNGAADGWAANVFTATETLFVTAVATYTVWEKAGYSVLIYTGVDALPTSGTLAAVYAGAQEYSGFHVLPIPGPAVPVSAGEKFSVVVKYSPTGCGEMIPVETRIAGYTNAADANPGESFTSSDGVEWTDLNAPVNQYTSACIKALAVVTATYCNDNDPCTEEEWDGSQCVHPPSTAPCDDGLDCTEDDVCASYECLGTPVAGKCAIGGVCYDDGEIDPSDDCRWCQAGVDPRQWQPRPPGTPCVSGNECVREETCDASAQCVGTAEPDTKQCDDDQGCTWDDHCDGAGTCAGTAYSCPAPGQCEESVTCDGAGGCARVFKDQGTACGDGQICTWDDVCDGAGGCAGTPYTCEPNECQYTSVCDGTGACATTWKPEYTFCTSDGNGCTDDVCRNGQCVHQSVPNNTPCGDGSLCTTVDKCQAGVCVGSAPVQCQAQDSCHEAGVCDPQTGECSNPVKVEGSACDDGSVCTKDDRCDSQGVCVGTAYVCGPPNECQVSSQCDGLGGCIVVNKTNGLSCGSDGNSCTDDVCQAGQCAHN